MLAFALTRWPGLMSPNFSAAYALMFCAGVFFPKRLVWWLPFVTMLVTDLLLNWYYHTQFRHARVQPGIVRQLRCLRGAGLAGPQIRSEGFISFAAGRRDCWARFYFI